MLILFLPTPAYSLDLNLDLGISFPSLSADIESGESNQVIATFNNDILIYPHLGLSNDLKYFGDTVFGYFLMTTFGFYKLSLQTNENLTNAIDKGTGIEVKYVTITPTVFADFQIKDVFHTVLGLGYGVSYMDIQVFLQ